MTFLAPSCAFMQMSGIYVSVSHNKPHSAGVRCPCYLTIMAPVDSVSLLCFAGGFCPSELLSLWLMCGICHGHWRGARRRR